jgi:hypothetical protein
MMHRLIAAGCLSLWFAAAGCGGSDADALGVGAQCTTNDQCDSSADFDEVCLSEFKGGYCGLADCAEDLDCPEDSACIAYTATESYCFRTCADKAECNANREVDNEANCSSSVTFTDGAQGRKACVPPSSGI